MINDDRWSKTHFQHSVQHTGVQGAPPATCQGKERPTQLLAMQYRGAVCPGHVTAAAPSSMSSGAVWVMVPQLKVSMRDCTSSCRAIPKSATCSAGPSTLNSDQVCVCRHDLAAALTPDT